MTQQFHEGQEVEVPDVLINGQPISWRKAKIVAPTAHTHRELYTVKFHGSRAVFDAKHIRAIPTLKELYGDNHGEAFES